MIAQSPFLNGPTPDPLTASQAARSPALACSSTLTPIEGLSCSNGWTFVSTTPPRSADCVEQLTTSRLKHAGTSSAEHVRDSSPNWSSIETDDSRLAIRTYHKPEPKSSKTVSGRVHEGPLSASSSVRRRSPHTSLIGKGSDKHNLSLPQLSSVHDAAVSFAEGLDLVTLTPPRSRHAESGFEAPHSCPESPTVTCRSQKPQGRMSCWLWYLGHVLLMSFENLQS